jgi:hypothetical protein
MAKLYVIGDSFTAPPKPPDPQKVWPMMVAEQLGVELVNASMVGTAQDWCWLHLQQWLLEMTPDDYLIVALTHPSRYWFFDDIPKLTHPNIIDLDRWCSKEQAKAIEMFVRYIQRPTVDIIQVNNRLAYIAYQVKNRGLRRPLMIKCFDQDVSQGETFPELNWANGILMEDVQRLEFDPPDLDEDNTGYWHGIDARYNHMCLSNHPIMAAKVVDALLNDKTLDLKSGFLQKLLKVGSLDDLEFCAKELSVEVADYNREKRDSGMKLSLPWKKRVNLNNI